jgi:hypothetical protein
MPRRILVTGGRDNYDWLTIERAIFDHCKQGDVIVHGAASGADSIASQLVRYNPDFFDEDPFPADWDTHGKAAGGIRNQAMLDSGIQGALVFAGGNGTADMVRRLQVANVKFYDYSNYWGGKPK